MPEATFLDATELVINMGPQHPSTHGVLRVILKLDGEKVNGTECVIGYLHRGVEKIGENRTYQQFAPYVDRMDYVASVSNGLGYCLAVEKLLNMEAPPRAQAVRVILTELNRIASHLLWLGTHALDIGAITPVFYCLREREEVLKIFENYCGARLTTHAFRIGGLQYETYDGFEEEVKKFCDWFIPKVDEYERLLTTNRIWVGRLKGVGVLSADECKEYGVTGPVLRAAGVAWDLRKAQPYSGYEQYEFEIPIGENGDTYDRYTVRMEEMRQATRIIRQAVDRIPSGPIMGKVPKVVKPPVGEVYVSIEAPKGELGYFIVSDNSTQPYRMRVRPPSFVNLQALDRMVRGGLVADVVAIIGTLDIVLGEVDRCVGRPPGLRGSSRTRLDRRGRRPQDWSPAPPGHQGWEMITKLLRTIFLVDLFQGLWVTFRNQDPKRIYTEQYPAERPKVGERYRGAPRLNINPDNGETLCISCNLCALACPENLIVVTSQRNEQTKRKDLTTFIYDTSRCMFCGLCEDACPVDALELTQAFELASYTREGAIWDRQMLEEGPKPTQYKC